LNFSFAQGVMFLFAGLHLIVRTAD